MEINIEPTIKQAGAWIKLEDKHTQFILFGGGAGGGKSWLGCEWLVKNCFVYPGSKWFIGRVELKRILVSTFITFIKVCKHHNISRELWKYNGQYNYIEFTNGSRIDLLDLKNLPSDPLYERLGSIEYTGGWLEEAGEIDFAAFDTLKSRIGRCMNNEYDLTPKILITCNPKKNWLYYDFYKPYKNKTLKNNYFFLQSLYGDNPHTSEKYGEMLSQIRDKVTRDRLMYGEWEYDNDPSKLFKYDSILGIFDNKPNLDDEQKYLSVDVARFGKDKIVIIRWTGFHIEEIKEYSKKSTKETRKIIGNLAHYHNIPREHIIIDEDGVGGGVVDELEDSQGFVNNSKQLDEPDPITGEKSKYNYANLKSQCYFALADYVNKGKISCYKGISPRIKGLLIEDLEQIKRKDPDNDNKLAVISKEEIKENLGRSCDFSDAIMERLFYIWKEELEPAWGF